MTGDIRTSWDTLNGSGDWDIVGGVLKNGSELQTAIYISLFTDRIAGPDDTIPDGSQNRRGWWGDEDEKIPIGSRLWLLARAKQTEDTRASAQDYIAEALKWLIDDGIVAQFDIDVQWQVAGMLAVRIEAYQPGEKQAQRFDWVWKRDT